MTRAEQTVRARMQEIRELVRSGATEMVGKTKRAGGDTAEYRGQVTGRYGGGFSKMFPEIERAGLTPSRRRKPWSWGAGSATGDCMMRLSIRLM